MSSVVTKSVLPVIETSTFTRQLSRHLDDDGYVALRAFPSVHPAAGDVIRGTGGVRKIRWAMPGRGKRGGSRIIDYWLAKEEHIYLLTVYAKGAKDDLTAAERDAWRGAMEAIDNLIPTQAKRNLSSRSGIGGVLSAT